MAARGFPPAAINARASRPSNRLITDIDAPRTISVNEILSRAMNSEAAVCWVGFRADTHDSLAVGSLVVRGAPTLDVPHGASMIVLNLEPVVPPLQVVFSFSSGGSICTARRKVKS